MPTLRRVRVTALFVSAAFLGALAFGWLWLYLDSLLARRRAEHLIADLKAFPFSTAGFAEVRGLATSMAAARSCNSRLFTFRLQACRSSHRPTNCIPVNCHKSRYR
jgi:hypothetical protein